MRPTFDRRLWILLYSYLLLKCIQPTNQQIIEQNCTKQESTELADISGPRELTVEEDRFSTQLPGLHPIETETPSPSLYSGSNEKLTYTTDSYKHRPYSDEQEKPSYQYVEVKVGNHVEQNHIDSHENLNGGQQANNVDNERFLHADNHKLNVLLLQTDDNSLRVERKLGLLDDYSRSNEDESDGSGGSQRSIIQYTTSIDPPFKDDSTTTIATTPTTTTTIRSTLFQDDLTTVTEKDPVSKIRLHPDEDDDNKDDDDSDYSQGVDARDQPHPQTGQPVNPVEGLDNGSITNTSEYESIPHIEMNISILDTSIDTNSSSPSDSLKSISYSSYENETKVYDSVISIKLQNTNNIIINNNNNNNYDNNNNYNNKEILTNNDVDNNDSSDVDDDDDDEMLVRVRRSSSNMHINNNSYSKSIINNDYDNKFDKPNSYSSYKAMTQPNQSASVLLQADDSDIISINNNNNNNNNNDNNNNTSGGINGGVFSSSDISQSDIRYNETLLTDSNPSLSSSSTSLDLDASQKVRQTVPITSETEFSPLSSSPASSSLTNISPLSETDVSNFSSIIDKNLYSDAKLTSNEQMDIIDDDDDDDDDFDSSLAANNRRRRINRDGIDTRKRLSTSSNGDNMNSGSAENGANSDTSNLDDYMPEEPRALPLRPIIRGPAETDQEEEMSVVYAEQHTEIKLICEVDMDIATSIWYKNGQIVHTMDRSTRPTDYRFIRDSSSSLTITNVMLEDDGKWQCEAENFKGYVESARPVKLVVLDRPKAPYLLIDSRRLDAGNIFVPVKENSELSLACISEGGNPKPTLTWEVLLSPGVDRHAQKVAAEVLELEEIKSEKDKEPYKINSGAKSEARLPAVYRAHHNARILCVMEHPTLKVRQNASLLLDVQYTPSFAISRTPGFGYPLREGIEVSLKCDVDSNPPSTPVWQKDDGETPVQQTGDGYLNFTSIRREHSGWYKCTSRHLNFQYSSIGYYLSVRYDSVDVTSEPDDQEVSVAASHNPYKGQLEVQLGGAVTLQCPQGSLGCWSHLDPVTARLRGLGTGQSTPTGQFSLKNVVYQEAGTYKCIGHSGTNKKKLEVLQTVQLQVKGPPTVVARNATPRAYPGSPLHLSVEFCANPPAYAARWLHGDRVYTPGNQYGIDVLAYSVIDLPTPFCKEARLTYVHMHERVPRTFYFIVSSPGGVAEAIFKVNFTLRHRAMSNSVDEDEEELSEPEEIHFPVFGSSSTCSYQQPGHHTLLVQLLLLCIICILVNVLL